MRFIREVGQRARAAQPAQPEAPAVRPPDADSPLRLAMDHVDIGTVVAPETRLRLLKRAMVRLSRHFTHHQVIYNRAVLEEISSLRSLPALGDAHRLLESRLATWLAALDVQMEQLQDQLSDLAAPRALQHGTEHAGRAILTPASRRFDEFYVAFEDRFRGTRDEVKSRLAEHLDDIATLPGEGRVLDLGPGRGELLELLTSRGIDAYGIDKNESVVSRGRERNLDVVVGDALAHLRGLADGTLAAVTGMHIVEHLDLNELFEIVGECHRVLRPGGRILLETPNPTTWQVGANTFYLDPTHVRPVHPLFLEFLLSETGFNDVTVRMLHRAEPAPKLGDHLDATVAEAVARFADMYGGDQDYVVLGTRPAGS